MGIIGRTTIGDTEFALFGSNNLIERNELTQEVDIDRITLYGRSGDPAGTRVKLAIYSNRVTPEGNDHIDRLLAVSEEKIWSAGAPAEWHTHLLSTPVHLMPNIYWLVWVSDTMHYYRASLQPPAGEPFVLYSSDPFAYANPFPNLAPDDWIGQTKWGGASIYAGIPERILIITATSGGTTDPIPGSYPTTVGEVVTVIASADAGYIFDHWDLDGVNVGATPSYEVTMDTDHTLHAVFTALPPGKGTLEAHAYVGP